MTDADSPAGGLQPLVITGVQITGNCLMYNNFTWRNDIIYRTVHVQHYLYVGIMYSHHWWHVTITEETE